MEYKMSIIIPVYNVEKYIKKSFETLKRQSIGFENIEILFVDDCSTDLSYNIIKEFEKKYDNVKVFKTDKNSGVAGKPRNVALRNVTTNYVLFLDPDDTLYENACELLFDKIESSGSDIVSGVHTVKSQEEKTASIAKDLLINSFTNPNNNKSFRELKTLEIFKDKDEIYLRNINDLPYFIMNWGLSSKLFRMDFLNKNGIKFPEKIPGEDSVFLYKSLILAEGIYFINEPIYQYTQFRSDDKSLSVTLQYNLEKNLGRLKSYKKIWEVSKNNKIEPYFIRYYLPIKLNYFMNNFIINKNIPLSDITTLFQYGKELFNLVLNNNSLISDKHKIIFKYAINEDFKKVFDYCKNIKINDGKKEEIPYINEIKIAAIMDPFTFNAFSKECQIIPIYPENWYETFEKNDIDLFFCESAWFGINKDKIVNGVALESEDGPWKEKIKYCLQDNEKNLLNVINYCKKHDITTIFWNKEDPKAFNHFIDAAINFDFVFTTDKGSVNKYKARGIKNVNTLLFATQINLFNPIERNKRTDDVIFAGSWYNDEEERCNSMRYIFDKILESKHKLKIYNRKSDLNVNYWNFPEEYEEYIYPAIPFNKMADAYKESKFSLNFNTITKSETMFARRVFELMSSNTFVISNYSKGVYNLFKDNVIYFDRNNDLHLDDKEYVDKICEENLYNVLKHHTYHERLKYILNVLNFKYKQRKNILLIFYIIKNKEILQRLYEDYDSIKYPYKQAILIVDNDSVLSNADKRKEFTVVTYDKCFEKINKYYSFNDNYYFIFRNLHIKMSDNFVNKALLHYQYLAKEIGIQRSNKQYIFEKTSNFSNIMFKLDENRLNTVLTNMIENNDKDLEVYNI